MSVPETNAFPHKDYNPVSYSNDIMLLKVKENSILGGLLSNFYYFFQVKLNFLLLFVITFR